MTFQSLCHALDGHEPVSISVEGVSAALYRPSLDEAGANPPSAPRLAQ